VLIEPLTLSQERPAQLVTPIEAITHVSDTTSHGSGDSTDTIKQFLSETVRPRANSGASNMSPISVDSVPPARVLQPKESSVITNNPSKKRSRQLAMLEFFASIDNKRRAIEKEQRSPNVVAIDETSKAGFILS
jgi:hypothetical protein